ncbi:hypothetical protein Pcinc_023938 [Petrolisthes cinctipes]|uniref:CCHC-type domain-containing protein n=1 Tax=Petrolisthes cinctipes TaxID=88211 RepID=A0AAE1FBH2_PETCI|nr:hypothetical protein Pcinc_023938 [Petrolisthes cinctipes]
MELENLTTKGQSLGYEGSELRHFVSEQQTILREERQREREERQIQSEIYEEKEKREFELRRAEQELEHAIRLQEKECELREKECQEKEKERVDKEKERQHELEMREFRQTHGGPMWKTYQPRQLKDFQPKDQPTTTTTPVFPQQPSPVVKPHREKICFLCHEKGHIARVCWGASRGPRLERQGHPERQDSAKEEKAAVCVARQTKPTVTLPTGETLSTFDNWCLFNGERIENYTRLCE